jgi:chromosome partitioning protein
MTESVLLQLQSRPWTQSFHELSIASDLRATVLTVISESAQSGKTTTAFGLASALARRGESVLAVDLDRACALTHWLAPGGVSPTHLGSVLLGGAPAAEAVVKTRIEGLDLLPGSSAIGRAELLWADDPDAAKRLGRAILAASEGHSFVVIDCPPGLPRLAGIALQVAHAFLVPFAAHGVRAERFVEEMSSIARLWELCPPRPWLAGLLEIRMTAMNGDSAEVEAIRDRFRAHVFESALERDTDLRAAMRHGEVLYRAPMFERLTLELLGRLGNATEPRPVPQPSAGAERPLPPFVREISPDEEGEEVAARIEAKVKDLDVEVTEAKEIDPTTWNPKAERPLPETPPTGTSKLPEDFETMESDMFKIAAKNMGLDFVDLTTVDVTEELLATVPADLARELKVFPVKQTQMGLRIVLANPFDSDAVIRLRDELGLTIFPCVAPKDDVQRFIRKHYS